MTSSGTYSYSLSNADAVIGAYERIQIRLPSLRQEHWATGKRELNALFSELSNKTTNLWTVSLLSTTLVQGTATYSVNSSVVMLLDVYRSLNQGDANQTDIYLTPLSRTEYAGMAVKQTQGAPTTYWFDRLISPSITLWPVPDGGGPYTLNYYAALSLQDANLPGGETPNVPYRWYDAIIAGLAMRLARVYAPDLYLARKADYAEAWDTAASQDIEGGNVKMLPAVGGYFR